MDKLNKEELLKILAEKIQEKPRKERKKPSLDDEKKVAMLERLAAMRETVKQNREKRKSAVAAEFHKNKEDEIDKVFEKKYSTKFDKMTDLLTDLNENTKETLKLKKEKLVAKAAAAKPAEVKGDDDKPTVPAAVRPLVSNAPAIKPAAVAAGPVQQYLLPNRTAFQKCNTRF